MELLPHLPLKLIFDELVFDDILNLLWTPHMRKIVLNFYNVDMNMKDLIRLVLLQNFDNLIGRCPVVIEYLKDFLFETGMTRFEYTFQFIAIQHTFIGKFTPIEICKAFRPEGILGSDEYQSYINKKVWNEDLEEILEKVESSNDLTNSRQKELNLILQKTYCEIEKQEMNYIAEYLEKYFYDPKSGFKNTLRLCEHIPEMRILKRSRLKELFGIRKPSKLLDTLEKIFVIGHL